MDYFEFYGVRGCLMVLLRIGVLVFAIICLATNVYTRFAWLALIGEAIDILVYIIYRRATRKNWNRENSYWSRKDDVEDSKR